MFEFQTLFVEFIFCILNYLLKVTLNLWISTNQVLVAKYAIFLWFKNILWNLKKTNKVKLRRMKIKIQWKVFKIQR